MSPSAYEGLIDRLVIDEADADEGDHIVTRTLMSDEAARRTLAEAVLEAAAVPR